MYIKATSNKPTSHKPQATSHKHHKPQATSHKPQATSHKPQACDNMSNIQKNNNHYIVYCLIKAAGVG
jgi:hypothetical protein